MLNAEDSGGMPFTTFDPPLTVTIRYSDIEIAGNVEESLTLSYWDTDTQTWLDAVTTCQGGEYSRDLDANTFSLPVCHLSEFAVLSEPGALLFLPITIH